MGVNIILENKAGERPRDEWDWIRYAGDREFAAMIGNLPHEAIQIGHPMDCECGYRPTDFAAWREAVAKVEWPNPGRYEKLIDLLEANPDYFIYLSY